LVFLNSPTPSYLCCKSPPLSCIFCCKNYPNVYMFNVIQPTFVHFEQPIMFLSNLLNFYSKVFILLREYVTKNVNLCLIWMTFQIVWDESRFICFRETKMS
jgi:hypothetical protein